MAVCRGSHQGPPVRATVPRPLPPRRPSPRWPRHGTTMCGKWLLCASLSKYGRDWFIRSSRCGADCRDCRKATANRTEHNATRLKTSDSAWSEMQTGGDNVAPRQLQKKNDLSARPLRRAWSARRGASPQGGGAIRAATEAQLACHCLRRLRISASGALFSWCPRSCIALGCLPVEAKITFFCGKRLARLAARF